ncbi:MAG: hypothetical protein R3B45_17365 [Bdellovibrionota bacterium]
MLSNIQNIRSTYLLHQPVITASFFLILICLTSSCAKEETFPEIGKNIASPIDIITSPDQEHFYVLNADLDRTYNKGSILVIDQSGEKITSISTPRLGRSLSIVDHTLIATFDDPGPEKGEDPQVRLYDITEPANPTLITSHILDSKDCNFPLNAVGRSNYRYYAMTCYGGVLYIGDLEQKTLKKVRDYPGSQSRRALYIDSNRGLLFAFPTVLGSPETLKDAVMEDTAQWDEDFNKTLEANEIPDTYEDSIKARRDQKILRNKYQFTVYDINKESQETDANGENFPLRDPESEIVESELRWLYFNLTNFDGTPDNPTGYTDNTVKYYRTNFWEAKPDPDDTNAFFLSHRGLGVSGKAPDANNIIRVSITGDIKANENGDVPKTKDFFNFQRVYGFGGAQNNPEKTNYTGDFEFTYSKGEKIIIVNDFRDLANFRQSGGAHFAVSAATLEDGGLWFAEKNSTSGFDGFYQLAVGKNGRIATCSFYGNVVILLDVHIDTDITEFKRVN